MRVGKYNIERADYYNIVLNDIVINKNTGAEYLGNSKYYSRWEDALMRVIDLHGESKDVKELLEELRGARKEIVQELKKLNLK